jgi:aquaporin Z
VTKALQLGALVFEQTSPSQFERAANELAVNQPISSVDEIHQNALPKRDALNAVASLGLHWPEYLMEVAETGLYLFLTCFFATLLQHPASPIRHLIPSGTLRRAFMGAAVGATVIAIAITPWGKQSGGHFNPAVTFTFYRLGKVESWDALFYGAAQFFGATSGVAIAAYILQGAPAHESVRYAITLPGRYGSGVAFVAELAISFSLMVTVLFTTNHDTLARYTPYFVGALYAIYITFETPLSGMSMNPARTFGSALHASYWHALWLYFLAPTLGMLVAAEVFLRARSSVGPYCAKLHHANNRRCIFHHGYRATEIQNF